MALRSFNLITWQPVAVADATPYTDTGYMGILGGSSTQKIRIEEIYMGGLATASAPMLMLLSRDSTVEATPTALTTNASDTSLDPATAALAAPPVTFIASTTKPQRSATLHLLPLVFNAFGGLVRWNASPNERELGLVGNTASLGELSLSAYTGSTASTSMASHIIYEPF